MLDSAANFSNLWLEGKKSTIVRWLTIRCVGVFWAIHQASVEQVSRALTWSSIYTFTSFYRVDATAAEDVAFGYGVLWASV